MDAALSTGVEWMAEGKDKVEARGFPDLLEGLRRLRGAVMLAAAVGGAGAGTGLLATGPGGGPEVATATLSVVNVTPSIEIRGPDRVHDEADFQAVTSDPMDGEDLVVTWFVDGTLSGTGPEFHYVPGSLHEHLVSASVSDGDGGRAVAVLQVDVTTSYRVVMEVLRPDQAVAGRTYTLGLGNVSLGLYEGSEIVWRRDGAHMGTGPELVLVAGRGPTERIEVGLDDEGTFVLANTTVIGIREPLLPVEVLGAEVTSYDSVAVRWNTSGQRELFDAYVVRLSTDPLSTRPESNLEWLDVDGTPISEHQEITTRSTSRHDFAGLRSGTTYYICVYVVGASEVVCSNSVEATIPPRDVDEVPRPTEGSEDAMDHSMFLSVIILVIILIVVGTYVLRLSETN